MSKILISPLGVGAVKKDNIERREYHTAKYIFNNDESNVYETSFISAAIAQHLEIDKMILVGTSKSMWEEVYRYFSENSSYTYDNNYWNELKEKIKSSGAKNYILKEADLSQLNDVIDTFLQDKANSNIQGSKCKIITYGLDEGEVWSNFDLFMNLNEEFNNGDQIYLDITHSFRSIPLFMYLMMDFIQTLKIKDIELSGLYYGMLEVKKEIGGGPVPVIDYKPLFEISKWIRGVYDFTNYGNGYLISDLIDDKKVSDRVNMVSDLVNINYLENLKKQINKLNGILNSNRVKKLRVLNYIIPNINSFLNRFQDVETEWQFQLEMAKWFFENSRYNNSYICLVESILTYLCQLYNLDFKDYNNRKLVKNIVLSKKMNKKYSHLGKLMKLKKEYIKVNKARRHIAHGGLTGNKRDFNSDIENLYNYPKYIRDLLFDPQLKKEIINNISLKEL